MGMTIENDIKILQSRKEEALEEGYKGFASALGNAIDTMRKYQKIEQIVTDEYGYLFSAEKLRDIERVINGNDN